MEEIKGFIRNIPDFPKAGINFKDITPLLGDAKAFKKVIDTFAERHSGNGIDKVVSVESRGFFFGAALAYRIGAGIVPVRKPGKLPYETISASYELEYGQDTLEIHKDAVKEGEKVLIIDDLLATGGTIGAVCELVEKLGGNIVEIDFVIELGFLNGREKLGERPIFSLIAF
ncbi:MAG: adenine phosphoribosyltransferase [Candidatus Schekmanbacteria bacterium]|nr:MAG: adenine phosphoribosyltransferase [Candidatus Schekmanbacteria bacterium]